MTKMISVEECEFIGSNTNYKVFNNIVNKLNARHPSTPGLRYFDFEGAGRFVIGLAADIKIVEGEKLRKYILDYQKTHIAKL